MASEITVPEDLGASGAALWEDLTENVDYAPHELAVLTEACRVRDRLDSLDAVVMAQGVTVESPQGVKAHPALVESRAQQATFSRLIAALRIPDESTGTRPAARAARGNYHRRLGL